jgi:hypothetical protein
MNSRAVDFGTRFDSPDLKTIVMLPAVMLWRSYVALSPTHAMAAM